MLMPHYFTSTNCLHEVESRFAGLQNMSVELLALMLHTRQGQNSNLQTDISNGLQTVNPLSKLTILTLFSYSQHWNAVQSGFLLSSCSPNQGTDGDRKQREHRRLKTIIDQLTNSRTRGHGQPQRGECSSKLTYGCQSDQIQGKGFYIRGFANTMEYNAKNFGIFFQKVGLFRAMCYDFYEGQKS